MYHKLREADGTITRSCLWLGLKKGMFVPNTDVRDSVPYRYCHFLPVDITPTQRKNLAPPHPCCNGQGDQTFKWCRAGGFHEIFACSCVRKAISWSSCLGGVASLQGFLDILFHFTASLEAVNNMVWMSLMVFGNKPSFSSCAYRDWIWSPVSFCNLM